MNHAATHYFELKHIKLDATEKTRRTKENNERHATIVGYLVHQFHKKYFGIKETY